MATSTPPARLPACSPVCLPAHAPSLPCCRTAALPERSLESAFGRASLGRARQARRYVASRSDLLLADVRAGQGGRQESGKEAWRPWHAAVWPTAARSLALDELRLSLLRQGRAAERAPAAVSRAGSEEGGQ